MENFILFKLDLKYKNLLIFDKLFFFIFYLKVILFIYNIFDYNNNYIMYLIK